MKAPIPRSTNKSAGFIISLELLLLLAMVVFPLMLGMMLLGRKIVTLYLNHLEMIEQPLSRPVVWDSSGTAKPVGSVIGYDQFGAPLVLYRDATNGGRQPGVLLGVRPFRFTTVSKVYYDSGGAGCSGTPYVKSADPLLSPWPSVGFISQLQEVNYAVGNGNILYRGATGPGGAVPGIDYVWTSQDVSDGSPATSGAGVGACQATGPGEVDLVAVTQVADLDDGSNFATPYRLAFPTSLPLVGPISPNAGG